MLGIGGLTVNFDDAPPGVTGKFAARQDLCTAVISTNVTSVAGEIFGISSFVAADDNVLITNVSCTNKADVCKLSVEVWVLKGKADEPFDQATCGPDNMPRGGYILPTSAAVNSEAGAAVLSRSSAIDGVNSAILAPCAPHVNDATQNVTLDKAGYIKLHDGRCLVRVGESTARGAKGGDKTTIGPCLDHTKSGTLWALNSNGTITGSQGGCLTKVTGNGPYLTVLPCTSSSQLWDFIPATTVTMPLKDTEQQGKSGILVRRGDGTACLTLVEQSFVTDVAVATKILDPANGSPLPSASMVVLDDTRVKLSFTLEPGQVATVLTAALTSFDVHGASFSQYPLRDARVLSGKVDTEIIDAALALVETSAKRHGQIFSAHKEIWADAWNSSSVNISTAGSGSKLGAALDILEANYYGSQYVLQIAGRSIGQGFSNRSYPELIGATSLFGPFNTGGAAGCCMHVCIYTAAAAV
jgi:hypothetical protein